MSNDGLSKGEASEDRSNEVRASRGVRGEKLAERFPPLQRWLVKPANPELAKTLAADHNISPTAAQLLINRGLTAKEEIHHYFHSRLRDLSDPLTLPDMELAVRTLVSAIENKKRIVLYGDYDVDGITGLSILYLFLSQSGANVSIYIPNRVSEGYGLNLQALKKIHAQGCDLIIAIDNGTVAFEELDWTAKQGLEVIVIDHHESPSTRPTCTALINPKHPDSTYPDKALCSAGLSFNLAIALRAALRQKSFYTNHQEPDLKDFLDLVCLGTIADMVPLQGQNRLLTRYGLKCLNQTTRPGFVALKEVSGIQNRSIGTYEVSFLLAPRLNAAGRLADAQLGVQLLITEDRMEARRLAIQLDRLNRERRNIEQTMLSEAIAQVEQLPNELKRYAIVVSSDSWHPGVMGIVASRLVKQYQLPAFVIALQGEHGTGSARTFAEVNLYSLLSTCSDLLIRYGGHRAAAGLTIKKEKISAFREYIQAAIKETVLGEDLQATLHIDQELSCEEISATTVDELEQLSPFGIGNPEPLFVSNPIRLLSPQIVAERHLKVTVAGRRCSFPAIGFGLAGHFEAVSQNEHHYLLAYRPQWNEFGGERSIQLVLQSLRECPKS